MTSNVLPSEKFKARHSFSSSNQSFQNENTFNSSVSDNNHHQILYSQARQKYELEGEIIHLKEILINERKVFEEEKNNLLSNYNKILTEKEEFDCFIISLLEILKIENSGYSRYDMILTTLINLIKSYKKCQKTKNLIKKITETSNTEKAIYEINRMKLHENEIGPILTGFSELREIIVSQSKVIKNVMKSLQNSAIDKQEKLCETLERTNMQLNDQIELLSKTINESNSQIISNMNKETENAFKNNTQEHANENIKMTSNETTIPINNLNNQKTDAATTPIKLFENKGIQNLIKTKNNNKRSSQINNNNNNNNNERNTSSSSSTYSNYNYKDDDYYFSVEGSDEDNETKQESKFKKINKNKRIQDIENKSSEEEMNNRNKKQHTHRNRKENDSPISKSKHHINEKQCNNKSSKRKDTNQDQRKKHFDVLQGRRKRTPSPQELEKSHTPGMKNCTNRKTSFEFENDSKIKSNYNEKNRSNKKDYNNENGNDYSSNYAYNNKNEYNNNGCVECDENLRRDCEQRLAEFKRNHLHAIELSTSEDSKYDDMGQTMWMSKTKDLLSLERKLLLNSRLLNEKQKDQYLLQTKFQRELRMNPETMF